MKTLLLCVCAFLLATNTFGQNALSQKRTQIMTLGVFHFDFPNLDAVRTQENDKISVLDEPYRSEIIALAKSIQEFKPTLIAIETTPDNQLTIDSLYQLYLNGSWELRKNEIYQLGFRIGKEQSIDKLYCIDDFGVHYEHITAIFTDSTRLSRISAYQRKTLEKEGETRTAEKISSITEELNERNIRGNIQNSMAGYLTGLFKYEENEGDFAGVDFQTGRWFNRNLRIFRNMQRIPQNANDRILFIVGSDHLNLLNFFIESSLEYDLVSPIPYIEKARLEK
jgi:hypothetical protein